MNSVAPAISSSHNNALHYTTLLSSGPGMPGKLREANPAMNELLMVEG